MNLPQKKYLLNGSFEAEVYDLGLDSSGKQMFIKCTDIIKLNPKHVKVYDSRKEMRYELFCKKMRKGSKLHSFKGSKYFDYYIEQAKIRNPEVFI